MGRKGNICKDHKGKEYSNFSAMCKAYNKSRTTVIYRLNKGMSLDKALTLSNTDPRIVKNGIKCKDHLGNEYESFNSMCVKYNRDASSVRYRLKTGVSLEEALTVARIKTRQPQNKKTKPDKNKDKQDKPKQDKDKPQQEQNKDKKEQDKAKQKKKKTTKRKSKNKIKSKQI